MSFCAWLLAVLWGQMYVTGCLTTVNMVQRQQDFPLSKDDFLCTARDCKRQQATHLTKHVTQISKQSTHRCDSNGNDAATIGYTTIALLDHIHPTKLLTDLLCCLCIVSAVVSTTPQVMLITDDVPMSRPTIGKGISHT